ncbi:hypothetical protein [Sphingomonas sp. NPDC079357]|uniref:hypothetical protein n=1 Tax=Sphingomonas sp. NPDC079357 TaxID=3364518 RepID=UPI00384EBC5F
MSEDLDLSDVDPLKWAEVRKRVDVVRRYLALPHPTGVDRDRHAAELGLRTGQFYNLVRAWREHRQASALTLGVRNKGRPSRSRRGGVDPLAREIARQAIGELGRDAPILDLESMTVARCAAAGVRPPSRGTIRLLAKEGGAAAINAPATGIFVARTFVRLPMIVDGTVGLPAAAVVAESPGGRVLGFILTEAEADGGFDRIISTVRSRLAEEPLPVTATEGDARVLEQRLPGLRCKRETIPGVELLLASTVGSRVGHIELRSRRPRSGVEAVMQSARDVALSVEDGEKALELAMINHNRAIDSRSRSA